MQAGPEPTPQEDEASYRSDQFRMECMKVLPCSKRFVHDWTECPFAHPQEKARRRDPRLHNYTGIACPSMKKEGCCAFGDHCPYAHNVFEYWLHPTRYRTQLCNDGSNCKRKICFFAHSLDELRVPASKPFVSPEALAGAAAAAAADAEAKRKAATVGSPLSAFATVSPGPSPQRASFEGMRSAHQQAQQAAAAAVAAAAAELRAAGSGSAGPTSPSTTDEMAMGSSPADAAVHQALQQLTGAGFSSKDQHVIELVTSLLAQDRVSPEQAASILQQMLPPEALNTLQARLHTPRTSMDDIRCYSDPLGYRTDVAQPSPQQMRASSCDTTAAAGTATFHDPMVAASPRGGATAAAMLSPRQAQAQAAAAQASPHHQHQQQQQLHMHSLEHLAAMQAAQGMGYPPSLAGGVAQYQSTASGMHGVDASRRMSFESARSSFDTTGAPQLHTGNGTGSACDSRSASASSDDSAAGGGSGVTTATAPPARPALAAALLRAQKQAAQQAGQQEGQQTGHSQPRLSVEAALRRMSEEQVVASSAVAAEQQQLFERAVAQAAAQQHHQSQQHHHQQQQQQQQQRHREALQAMLQRQQQAARPSEDSTRMSFERGSMDLGTPRVSLDASYPANLLSSNSLSTQGGYLSGQLSGQLSTVPEQFPMINAPPPSNSWAAGAGRFSLDSATAADRLSQDLCRMSFEGGPGSARVAPQTANPFASTFFSPAGVSSERMSAPLTGERRLALPALPAVRTTPPAKTPGQEEEEESSVTAAHQQLLGGTALQRL